MKLTELAKSLDRRVVLQSSPFAGSDSWVAFIENVGFSCGFVTMSVPGKGPLKALEALADAYSGKELCVDGNTDKKRYIGPMEITAG